MSAERLKLIRELIRDVVDFPKPGIVFKDITPVLAEPRAFNACLDLLAEHYDGLDFDCVVGIESRGFIFGAALAAIMRKAFVPARKPGKLPSETYQVEYELEYGSDAVEMHRDALTDRERVVIVDDLLATGGTAWATGQLVRKLGGRVLGAAFVIELEALGGRQRMLPVETFSLLRY